MEPMDCLVIYVPTDAAPAVRQAIGEAGAGRLGNYSHCSFSLDGTGRFTPLSVHPYETPAFMTYPVDASRPD